MVVVFWVNWRQNMLIWQKTTCKCCKKQSVTFKTAHIFFASPRPSSIDGVWVECEIDHEMRSFNWICFLHDWSIISSVIRIYSSLKSSEKPSLRPWNLKLHEASSFFMSFWLHNYNRIDILLLVIILISWRNTVTAKMFPQINQKIPHLG